MYSNKPTAYCELCLREMDVLSKHHLIPRTLHSRRKIRRLFTRQEMTNNLLWLCYPCHKQIHVLFKEKDLATYYNTRERLLQNQALQRFVEWIKQKPAGFKPKSGSARHRH